MFIDPAVVAFFRDEMTLVKINAEVDTALAREFAVSGYPTNVLIHKDRQEVDRIVGFAPANDFVETLINYGKGIGTLDDLLNKFKANPDRVMAFEIADKYKYRGKSEDALKWLDKVIASGSKTDSLSGESRISRADLYRRAKDYDKALREFEAVSKDFDGDGFGQLAEIYIPICYKQKGDTVASIRAFEMFISKHPMSEDVKYAREQIAKLKGE